MTRWWDSVYSSDWFSGVAVHLGPSGWPTGTQPSLMMTKQCDLFDWLGGGTICLRYWVDQWGIWLRVARGEKTLVWPTGTEQSLAMMRRRDLFDWPGRGAICSSHWVDQWRTWLRVARGETYGPANGNSTEPCNDETVGLV